MIRKLLFALFCMFIFVSQGYAFGIFSRYEDYQIKSPAAQSEPYYLKPLAAKKSIVEFVHNAVSNLRYSVYKFGGNYFNANKGVYVVDCSSFVDQLLKTASPHAYFSLVNASGADKPASQNYYQFFTQLTQSRYDFWNKVDNVSSLQAGDIVVFRYKNHRGISTGGHVMVVMDKPVRNTDVYFVRVADSARSRHSQDTRKAHSSGIGVGTLLIKANPRTGHPSAYAWAVGGYWNQNVNIVMARPLDMV